MSDAWFMAEAVVGIAVAMELIAGDGTPDCAAVVVVAIIIEAEV